VPALLDEFHQAVVVLAGAGAVKQRLGQAFGLHLASVREHDVPETLRPRLTNLRKAMYTAQPAGGMSALEVSVRKMSEQEAAGHAASIVEMFAVLSLIAEPDAATGPRLRVVGGEDLDEDFFSRA
jgi:hypothetical protein